MRCALARRLRPARQSTSGRRLDRPVGTHRKAGRGPYANGCNSALLAADPAGSGKAG